MPESNSTGFYLWVSVQALQGEEGTALPTAAEANLPQ